MNLPGDRVFDAHWQDGWLILPVLFLRRQQWMDRIGWLLWSSKFGWRVSTGLHNFRIARKQGY